MARIVVPEADALLDLELPCLDKGFVRLIDYLGGDQRIVQAARVSYGEGTKSYRQDKALIHYLLKNEHTSPFEQVVLTFHAKMPIFVARQWVRHRTARLNEVSGRYSVMKDEFYVPSADTMKLQSDSNKQARADEALAPELAGSMLAELEADQRALYDHYRGMVDQGLAREIARVNLPLSLYTEWYWQIDLHNLFRFLWLRLDAHAQYEIRVYAEAMAKCAKAVAPLAWEAFHEHIVNGVRLSQRECVALTQLLSGEEITALSGKPLAQFEAKLARIRASELPEVVEEFAAPQS